MGCALEITCLAEITSPFISSTPRARSASITTRRTGEAGAEQLLPLAWAEAPIAPHSLHPFRLSDPTPCTFDPINLANPVMQQDIGGAWAHRATPSPENRLCPQGALDPFIFEPLVKKIRSPETVKRRTTSAISLRAPVTKLRGQHANGARQFRRASN